MSVSILTTKQSLCLGQLQKWVNSEAKLYGRTDDNFILMFLYSCDFDMKLAKNTFILYYENRIKYPQWWTNRDLKDPRMSYVLNLKTSFILTNSNAKQPAIAMTHLSRFGSDMSIFEDWVKYLSIAAEMCARSRNCQMNGFVSINDCSNMSWRLVIKFLWPPLLIALLKAFHIATPIKLKSFILLNPPVVASSALKICEPFLSESVKSKIHFCCLSELPKLVPLEWLPEEFGGIAGPMQRHEDAFVEEMLSFNDYLIDDSKYGFH